MIHFVPNMGLFLEMAAAFVTLTSSPDEVSP
ncbi:hypothetical protein X744_30110 [Mesorhizobium sp. LNJC372A00]|nr:hypothetical protein X745_29955 [Mesorhizobium sp. LNJC374B00]ESY52164.1 hypothetical protein X744_30110 [Mesorhizobium sp. LNJC372A00]